MLTDRSITLEEWIIENEFDTLREDIETHVEVLAGLEDEDDRATLVRMVMMSVRQDLEAKLNE